MGDQQAATDLTLKKLPYYKDIVKSFIQKQMNFLVEQMSEEVGEECVVMAVNLQNQKMSHLGSKKGKAFLDERNDLKSQFLSYCIKSNTQTSLGQQGTHSVTNTSVPTHASVIAGVLSYPGTSMTMNKPIAIAPKPFTTTFTIPLIVNTNSMQSIGIVNTAAPHIQSNQSNQGNQGKVDSTKDNIDVDYGVNANRKGLVEGKSEVSEMPVVKTDESDEYEQDGGSDVEKSDNGYSNYREVMVHPDDFSGNMIKTEPLSEDENAQELDNTQEHYSVDSMEHNPADHSSDSNQYMDTSRYMRQTAKNQCVCKHCGKAFQFKKSLRKHLLIHTDQELELSTPAGDGESPEAQTSGNNRTSDTFEADYSVSENEMMFGVDNPTSSSPGNSKSRFRLVDEDKISQYEVSHQSHKTRKNTKWALKTFQEWHTSTYNRTLDTATIDEETLCQILKKFYCEASPQVSQSRNEKLGARHAHIYSRSTLKNIRAALNRHFADINRNIDIVYGTPFRSANRTLDGFLREQVKAGLATPASRLAIYKPVIDRADYDKIVGYLSTACTSPVILRQCVWFNIARRFGARDLDQWRSDFFFFDSDETGREYVSLTNEAQQVVHISKSRGGDMRMYATGTLHCPVETLKFFLKKTCPSAVMLFNVFTKTSLWDPSNNEIWYGTKALAKRSFSSFMTEICKASNTAEGYTANSLKSIPFHD